MLRSNIILRRDINEEFTPRVESHVDGYEAPNEISQRGSNPAINSQIKIKVKKIKNKIK